MIKQNIEMAVWLLGQSARSFDADDPMERERIAAQVQLLRDILDGADGYEKELRCVYKIEEKLWSK